MADVYRPKPKANDGLQKLGTIAGMAVGGPAGAGVGASIGGMLTPAQRPGPANVQSGGAMGRRMQQIDQSPLRQIRDSINSLQYIQDPAQRAELAMPLMKADYMARMKR